MDTVIPKEIKEKLLNLTFENIRGDNTKNTINNLYKDALLFADFISDPGYLHLPYIKKLYNQIDENYYVKANKIAYESQNINLYRDQLYILFENNRFLYHLNTKFSKVISGAAWPTEITAEYTDPETNESMEDLLDITTEESAATSLNNMISESWGAKSVVGALVATYKEKGIMLDAKTYKAIKLPSGVQECPDLLIKINIIDTDIWLNFRFEFKTVGPEKNQTTKLYINPDNTCKPGWNNSAVSRNVIEKKFYLPVIEESGELIDNNSFYTIAIFILYVPHIQYDVLQYYGICALPLALTLRYRDMHDGTYRVNVKDENSCFNSIVAPILKQWQYNNYDKTNFGFYKNLLEGNINVVNPIDKEK